MLGGRRPRADHDLEDAVEAVEPQEVVDRRLRGKGGVGVALGLGAGGGARLGARGLRLGLALGLGAAAGAGAWKTWVCGWISMPLSPTVKYIR